ncbi:MAG: transglutaminaseTgpA domain-containing protein [Anaerolineales bacterium]
MSVILLVFMLQAAAARLVVTEWTEFLVFAQSLATLGTILGIALGYSAFQRRTLWLLILGYSITLIPWQMTLAIKGELLSEKLLSVGGRFLNALQAIVRNEPVVDSLPFVIFISTVLWFVGIASGYGYVRHNSYLIGTLPGLFFLLIIHQYDPYFPERNWLLGAYLLLALMLLGRYYYLQNRASWQQRRVFQVHESSFDITRGLVIAAALFVFVAWNLPTPLAEIESAKETWDRLTKPWELLQDRLENAVKPLQSQSSASSPDFYSAQLSLGTGNPLEDTIIFAVRPDDIDLSPPRYYWRGFVYDVYFNNYWYTRSVRTESFDPTKGSIPVLGVEQGQVATFTFFTNIPQSLVYAASQPTWISREANTRTFVFDDGEQNLTAFYATPAILPGEQYRTRAVLINPSVQELRAAGTEYPEWIVTRYVQGEYQPRIAALAAEITAGLETPYDKAEAITRYLRSEIEYANPLPEPPPADTDVLEWVLFDLKQGFCNYYASAEVLMLRSLGIPARLAVGFAEGEFDAENEAYIVRYYDAHAWPEVYFPGIGWVEFEPTANQEPLIRPDRPQNIATPTPNTPDNFLLLDEEETESIDPEEQQLEEETVSFTGFENFSILALYLSIVLTIGILLIILNQRYAVLETLPIRLQSIYERNGRPVPSWLKQWAHWNALTRIQRSYETINRSLRLLGAPPAVSRTPAERAEKLIQILPKAKTHIRALSREHQIALFTQTAGDTRKAKRASLMIRLHTMQARIQKLRDRMSNRYR